MSAFEVRNLFGPSSLDADIAACDRAAGGITIVEANGNGVRRSVRYAHLEPDWGPIFEVTRAAEGGRTAAK
jgi:hypothetical protein